MLRKICSIIGFAICAAVVVLMGVLLSAPTRSYAETPPGIAPIPLDSPNCVPQFGPPRLNESGGPAIDVKIAPNISRTWVLLLNFALDSTNAPTTTACYVKFTAPKSIEGIGSYRAYPVECKFEGNVSLIISGTQRSAIFSGSDHQSRIVCPSINEIETAIDPAVGVAQRPAYSNASLFYVRARVDFSATMVLNKRMGLFATPSVVFSAQRLQFFGSRLMRANYLIDAPFPTGNGLPTLDGRLIGSASAYMGLGAKSVRFYVRAQNNSSCKAGIQSFFDAPTPLGPLFGNASCLKFDNNAPLVIGPGLEGKLYEMVIDPGGRTSK